MKKVVSLVLSLLMIISVMASLNITAYAATTVNTVAFLGVTIPRPGNSPSYNYTYSGTGVSIGNSGFKWYEKTGDKTVLLTGDSKFVAGKTYMAKFDIYATSGYELSNSLSVTIDGYAASLTSNGGRDIKVSVCAYYVFTCQNKDITAITLNASKAFVKGTVLKTDYFTASGEGVFSTVATSFTKEGEAIALGETVTSGNYGATVLIAPTQGYKLSNTTTVKYNNNSFTLVNWIGSFGLYKSADNLWTVDCTHNYGNYQYNADNHWKECSACHDKTEVAAHNFNEQTVGGDTVHTCSVCGFVLTSKKTVNGFMFADVTGGVKITAYKGADTAVQIPSTLDGKTVVSIGDYAFATAANKSSITSITIPSTVKSIGANAFNGCSSLASVVIPTGVKRIEKETFANCTNLASITVPYGVTFIGESAFYGCGFASIVIPCSVTAIGDTAFRNCNSLTSVVVPDSVTYLGNAFMACPALKSVVIGNGVTAIAQSTFDASNALQSIVLPAGLKTIGKYNFDNKPNFNNIFFRGTQQQYNGIEIKSYNTNSAQVSYNHTTRYDVGQHKYSAFKVVAPTCVETGYTVYACEGCGDAYRSSETAATGVHTYNSGAVTTEPTCVAAGVKTYLCTVCGNAKTEAVSATGIHTYDAGKITVEPKCTENGQAVYTCTVCGNTKTEPVAPTGHVESKSVVTPATAKADGSVTSTCSVCGEKFLKGTIAKIKTIKLKTASYTYNGKALKPAVVVTDSKGATIKNTCYTVKYTANKNVGTATVTVTFKGNYKGTHKLTFKINPKTTTVSKVTSPKKKQLKITWKKQSTQTTGYQVQYTTDKNFKKGVKTLTVSKNKTTSKTVSKLTSKKKYYVRIRTFKTISGKKYYSGWKKYGKAVAVK